MASSSESTPEADSKPTDYLDTTGGELAFFKAVAHARPAGAHRHFHMMTVQNMIRGETGEEVTIEGLWRKFGEYYDREYFDSNEIDPDAARETPLDPDIAAPSLNSSASSSSSPSSSSPASDSESMDVDADAPPRKRRRANPTNGDDGVDSDEYPSIDYNTHPHFRREYILPIEIHKLIAERAREEDAATEASSRPPSPVGTTTKKKGGRKKAEASVSVSVSEDADRGGSMVSNARDSTGNVTRDGTGSPAVSTRALPGRRGRAESTSKAKAPPPPTPTIDGDSDSSLSEPGGEDMDEDDAEENAEEELAAESVASRSAAATPAAESVQDPEPEPSDHEEAPAKTTRSKGNRRGDREPTVDSVASASATTMTRSASKRTAAATDAKRKKAVGKKKK